MTIFKPITVDEPTLEAIRATAPLYEEMLLRTVSCIVERFQRAPEYNFIDTKIDIHTGEDLSQEGTPVDLFGRETVYGWIQGRGLEALAGHHQWIGSLSLAHEEKQRLQRSIGAIIKSVVTQMEEIRLKNNGHVFFWLDREGHAFALGEDGEKIVQDMRPDLYNVTDIFYAKGLLASALFLDDKEMLARAKDYFWNTVCGVEAELIYADQQSFDPKNPAGAIAGRFSHGTRMLALGGLALATRYLDDPLYVSKGVEFLDHVLERHVNLNNRFAALEEYDFVEFIDAEGAPYWHKGTVISDSGHACEFVGLALKFVLTVEEKQAFTPEQQKQIDAFKPILLQILFHNFALGFDEEVGGIYKNYSLDRREPANSDMPWWNLPETMRAALFACRSCTTDAERKSCLEIAGKCSNAFLKNFINPDVYWMAYQTIDKEGKPVKVIPATPDLDPGYHTGLSIIDFLNALDRERR